MTAADESTAQPAPQTGPAVVTSAPQRVFRTRNADGVVEFNDYGIGDPVELLVVPPSDPESARLVGERVLDIEALALEMADDRIAREAAREERLALARERADRDSTRAEAPFTDSYPLYYPLRVPGFRRPYGRFDRPRPGGHRRRAPRPPMAPAEPPSQRISDLPLSP